jgi:hypothetical protein
MQRSAFGVALAKAIDSEGTTWREFGGLDKIGSRSNRHTLTDEQTPRDVDTSNTLVRCFNNNNNN